MFRRRAASLIAAVTLGLEAAMLPSAAPADTSWGDVSSRSSGGFEQHDTSWGD